MSNYWLSILIPTSRPDGLVNFISSLQKNSSNYNGIQIVVLQDGAAPNVEIVENITLITRPRDGVLRVPLLMQECFKEASADWIMLGNDDIICETAGWDDIVKKALESYTDGIGLVWPNDNMLQERLACFPIFHRKIFELVHPVPYRRYKHDDTIFNAFPVERRKYLPEVMFRHENDKGTIGFKLDDNRIYPIDIEAAKYDEDQWHKETVRRYKNRKAIRGMLGIKDETRVMIGISTMEMARRADFYDHYELLTKPENTCKIVAHGQSPAIARNMIFKGAFDADCTHVFLLDDDTAFKPDTLTRLLSHNKEVVCGLQLMRQFPHKPIIFDHFQGTHAHWRLLRDGESGLIPIVAAGLGCVLIRIDLLENMELPWVRLGELQSDNWCDDIGFWGRAQSKDMWCDLNTPIGHNANITVWPNRIGTTWYSSYESNGTGQAHVPQEKWKDDTNGTNTSNKCTTERAVQQV